jgi:hypothetical protein
MGSHVRQRAGCGDGVARTIWTYGGSDKTRKGRLLRGRQRRDCRCRLVSGMGGRGWSCSGLFILAVGRPRARPLCRDRSFPQTYRSGHPRASKVLLAATTSSVNSISKAHNPRGGHRPCSKSKHRDRERSHGWRRWCPWPWGRYTIYQGPESSTVCAAGARCHTCWPRITAAPRRLLCSRSRIARARQTLRTRPQNSTLKGGRADHSAVRQSGSGCRIDKMGRSPSPKLLPSGTQT